MFWVIAWRNIWANKRRAFLKIALSIFCTIFLIFTLAFMHGQHEKMIRDAVEIYTGYLQITGKDYHDYPDYDHLIYNLNEVKTLVSTQSEIEKASERFETFALFAGAEDSVGGMLIGINPEFERNLSRIQQTTIFGQYLHNNGQPQALIGKKLAERLNVGLGDELTYISQAVDFSMAADILTITGIFVTGSNMDAHTVFINKSYMDEVFLSENIASHYILLPKKNFRSKELKYIVGQLNKKLDLSQNEAIDWETSLFSMLQLVRVDSAFGYFSYGILVMVIFFVIMIFSLISVFQRTKEIGVLRAMGTKPRQVLFMLMCEAFIIGLISIVIGGIIGFILVYHYYTHPIEINVPPEILYQYQKWGVVDMVFPTVINPVSIISNCLFVLLLNIVAVIYPASVINRYKPIEAINYV